MEPHCSWFPKYIIVNSISLKLIQTSPNNIKCSVKYCIYLTK